MIYMPTAVTGKAWKFAHPYHGPLFSVLQTNIETSLVDDLGGAGTIFVAVNFVHLCYSGVPDTSWTGHKKAHT